MRQPFPTESLGNIVSITGGGTPSKSNADYWKGSIPWISPKEMKVWEIHRASSYVSDEAVRESSCTLIEPPAILIVVRGMILIHTVPVAISRVPLVINQDMKALTPREGVDHEYLAFMIKSASRELLGRVSVAGHGTRRLTTDAWKSLQIPLPAIEEQNRLVATLKENLERLDEIERIRKQLQTELPLLRDAILRKAFAGEL